MIFIVKAALSELSSTKQQIEGQIREKTTDYEKLQSKLRQLQSEVDDIKFSRSSTDSELESVTQTLKGINIRGNCDVEEL